MELRLNPLLLVHYHMYFPHLFLSFIFLSIALAGGTIHREIRLFNELFPVVFWIYSFFSIFSPNSDQLSNLLSNQKPITHMYSIYKDLLQGNKIFLYDGIVNWFQLYIKSRNAEPYAFSCWNYCASQIFIKI